MLLVFETSTRHGAVCLYHGETVKGRSQDLEPKEGLAVEVDRLMQGRWDDLTGYAISIGPGSFTGLRLGLSLLKGIAFAHPRPVAAVCSLRAWAETAAAKGGGAPGQFASVVQARTGVVHFASFEGTPGKLRSVPLDSMHADPKPAARSDGISRPGGRLLSETEWPARLPMCSGGRCVVTGSGAKEAPEGWVLNSVDRPDVAWVARLGSELLDAGEHFDAAHLEPRYGLLSSAAAAANSAAPSD